MQAEDPERDTHRFIARPGPDGSWQVVKVQVPPTPTTPLPSRSRRESEIPRSPLLSSPVTRFVMSFTPPTSDLWLICGDSTNPADVERVLALEPEPACLLETTPETDYPRLEGEIAFVVEPRSAAAEAYAGEAAP